MSVCAGRRREPNDTIIHELKNHARETRRHLDDRDKRAGAGQILALVPGGRQTRAPL